MFSKKFLIFSIKYKILRKRKTSLNKDNSYINIAYHILFESQDSLININLIYKNVYIISVGQR